MISTSTGAFCGLDETAQGVEQRSRINPWLLLFDDARSQQPSRRPRSTLFPLTPLASSVPLVSSLSTFRHVVLPQDIAQLLPKGKLLSEVRTLISFGGRSVGKQFFSSLSAALLSAASCFVRPQPRGGGGDWGQDDRLFSAPVLFCSELDVAR